VPETPRRAERSSGWFRRHFWAPCQSTECIGETLQLAKRVGPNRIAHFGRLVGARTLLLGGLAFVVFGPIYWTGWYTRTVSFDPGSFIVIVILIVMAIPIMIYAWREVRQLPRDFPVHADPPTELGGGTSTAASAEN
jgi:hypothetical protein